MTDIEESNIREAIRIFAVATNIMDGPTTREDGKNKTIALTKELAGATNETLAVLILTNESLNVAIQNAVHARMGSR